MATSYQTATLAPTGLQPLKEKCHVVHEFYT